MENLTRYNVKGHIDRYGDWQSGLWKNKDGWLVKFNDIKELLNTPTNKQSVPFSFDDIEEEFKSFAKSSYDYSLYSCGAMDMFNFIVTKLNSTRL